MKVWLNTNLNHPIPGAQGNIIVPASAFTFREEGLSVRIRDEKVDTQGTIAPTRFGGIPL